jgi:ribose transport system substrate-binding protein
MKKKGIKLFAILLTIALMMGAFAACGGGSDTGSTDSGSGTETEPAAFNPADYSIGFPMIIKTNPTIQIWLAAVVSKSKELGYPYHLYTTDGTDIAQVQNLAETGIAQHQLKGMIQHVFDDGSPAYFKKWSDAGLIVVSAHTDLGTDPSKYPGLTAWTACSSVDYSKMVADEIGKQIGGKGTVAITEGSFNPQENEAAAAFKEEMNAKYPDVVVLDPQEEGFDTAVAAQRATAILQANPDLVGAYSTTSSGPTTWATAQKNAGKKLCIISMDYTKPNLDLVKSGEVYGLVAQPNFEEFQVCVELLDKAFRGEEVPFANKLEAKLITQANVDDYYALIDQVNETMKEIN